MIRETDLYNVRTINGVEITCYAENQKELDTINNEEIEEYIHIFEEKTGRRLKKMKLKPDGEYMDCEYEVNNIPFERIRRITGYLTGTIEKWNDAKRAEEKDRVKHSTEMEELQ